MPSALALKARSCPPVPSTQVRDPLSVQLSHTPSVWRMQCTALRDTHFHQTLLTLLHTLDSGLPRSTVTRVVAHAWITRLVSSVGVLERDDRNPSQTLGTFTLSIGRCKCFFLHDLSFHGAPCTPRLTRQRRVSWRARSSADGSCGARGTQSSPCPPASASSLAR